MAGSRPSPAKKGRPGLAIIAGAVLVPASALAAVAIVRPAADEPAGAAATATTAAAAPATTLPSATTTTTTTEAATAEVSIVADPVSASGADVREACTVDGPALVAAEAAEEITGLQAAALDALRQICAEEGMALADPPAPPPVVRTVTVRSGSSSRNATAPQDTAAPLAGAEHENEFEHEDEHEDEYEDHEYESEHESHDGQTEATWHAARAQAAAAIAGASDVNPGSELIGEAHKKLAEADRAASRGKWDEAVEQANEAARKANRAAGGQ